MVRFEKNKLVIEIECQCPTGVWKDAMRDLLTGISLIKKDLVEDSGDCIYGLCELILEMLPEERDLREMLKLKEMIESDSRKTK